MEKFDSSPKDIAVQLKELYLPRLQTRPQAGRAGAGAAPDPAPALAAGRPHAAPHPRRHRPRARAHGPHRRGRRPLQTLQRGRAAQEEGYHQVQVNQSQGTTNIIYCCVAHDLLCDLALIN